MRFLHKQQLEMGGLLKRLKASREELRRSRKLEMERLLQRYQNLKMQMENQQRIIQQRVERYPITSPAQIRPSSGWATHVSRQGEALQLRIRPKKKGKRDEKVMKTTCFFRLRRTWPESHAVDLADSEPSLRREQLSCFQAIRLALNSLVATLKHT